MTIANSLNFERKAWRFPQELGMPAGVWSATGESEGDASSGSITFQHIFSSPANGLGDSNMYSIEHFQYADGSNNASGCMLTLNGMDRGSGDPSLPDLPINRAWAFELVDGDVAVTGAAGIFRTAISPKDSHPHIWVGTYQGIPTDFGDVLVRAQNPTAVFSASCALYGYWWTPDAINAPKGLRRPPEFFFSP